MQSRTPAQDPPILIVEDEPSISDAMRYALEREGFRVETAADGEAALLSFGANAPMLVLLDLMLPGIPGLDVCRAIRSESIVPIVMVSAKDGESDKVVSLEMGADDFITKPFSTAELVSRVRAHLRRAAMTQRISEPKVLTAGPVEMDISAHRVLVRGESVSVPPKEFALLQALLRGAGMLMAREVLLAEIWGSDYVGDTRTLDVHIKRLRAKIEEDPSAPRYLRTVRGLGYKFDVP